MQDKPPQPPFVCVVIPTYNEAANIGTLLEEIRALGPAERYHVVVVDDCSGDGTGDLVWAAGERLGGVELLARPAKLGLGTAYVAGFRKAYELGATYVMTMDADFSHSPKKIPELVEAVQSNGADLAIGSRYVPGGSTENWGIHRKVLSRVANGLAHRVLHLLARDCTAGFRCYRVEFLKRIDLASIQTDGYSVLVELLFHCQANGARVVEVPIVFRNRERGKSKISRAEIFKAIGTLWRLKQRRQSR